jgi:hypothetical protein
MKRVIRVLVAGASLAAITWASQAQAADPAFCQEYACRAVAQFERAAAVRCPVGGPRWTPNYDVHFGWCLTAAPWVAEREAHNRHDELERCRQ